MCPKISRPNPINKILSAVSTWGMEIVTRCYNWEVRKMVKHDEPFRSPNVLQFFGHHSESGDTYFA